MQRAKAILQRLSSESNPALVALFFIYEELNEIGGHLTQLASSINDLTNDSGVPYAEAGAKTNILAAHLAEEIKARIITAEEKLARCKH